MNKLWNIIESYTVIHNYEVKAETAEDAEDKLEGFVSGGMHKDDVEHIPSCDYTDDYNIECIEEIEG